jgi:predicted dienelactone hydrolase
MRALEITLAVFLAANIVAPLVFDDAAFTNARNWLSLLLLIVTGAHLSFEGYRWQMVPLYAIVGVVCVVSLAQTLRVISPEAGLAWGWRVAGVGVLALASALPLVFPVPHLPKPTGPHRVGTVVFSLTDGSRTAVYSPDPNDPREFVVQMWYPADTPANARPAPWIQQPERVIPAAGDYLDLPAFLFGHLGLFRTHSIREAPMVDDGSTHPILLFSHGWSGLQVQNTYQVEELASHGYVVAAVSHTYGSLVTVFPDGRVIFNNPTALPTQSPQEELEPAAERLVAQWSADLSTVLDHLERLNAGDPAGRFTGRLDLRRVGVLGHSTGGGATIEICGRDDRCQAALAMDPFMLPVSPEVQSAGLRVPFMAIFSERFSWDENDRLFEQLMGARSAVGYDLTLAGTVHYDFTDIPAFSPLTSLLGLRGEIGTRRLMEINRAYSLAFFDQTLRGNDSPLLDGPNAGFPEVSFRLLPPIGR